MDPWAAQLRFVALDYHVARCTQKQKKAVPCIIFLAINLSWIILYAISFEVSGGCKPAAGVSG